MTETNNKREEAKRQFDFRTKILNLKHTFSFDEAYDYVLAKRERKEVVARNTYREGVMKAEDKLKSLPNSLVGEELDVVNPLKHTFADGCYIREVFNPKGELIVTKIHKVSHPYFLLKGDMSILTSGGVKRIKAPYYGITSMGTKRVIYTHEDCVFVTVHITKETDLAKIEDEVIAKNFNEIDSIEEGKFRELFEGKEE